MIVKESVLFYTECWVDRCKVMNDEEEQKKKLNQWYGNVLNEMLNGESTYVERTRLNIDRSPKESIRSWILGAWKWKGSSRNTSGMTSGGFSMDETNSVWC